MKSKLLICCILSMFIMSGIKGQHSQVLSTDENRGSHGELIEIEMNGGKPFMDVLREKQRDVHISPRELEPHHLSGLMWTANGTPHRGEIHNRTSYAPQDIQCVDLYVLMRDGIYLYEAENHKLKLIDKNDFRFRISDNKEVLQAPVIFVYVINASNITGINENNRTNYAFLQSGSICQNIISYCSSEDMATEVILDIKKDEFAKILKLKNTNILMGQAVGYRH